MLDKQNSSLNTSATLSIQCRDLQQSSFSGKHNGDLADSHDYGRKCFLSESVKLFNTAIAE